MLKLTNLISEIENKYPLNLAESWDNVGLIIGSKDKVIKKVLVCLDITNEAIDKAIEKKVDLIISHHPLIFSPLKKIVDTHFISNKINKLIKNDIAVYSAHTNLDTAKDGLNDYVLKKMNLKGNKIDIELKPLRLFELEKEMDILDITKHIKKELEIETVRLVNGNLNKSVKKIALVTGAGDDFIKEVIDEVDLFITGDLKHHIALDSLEQGIYLLDIDHYGSEIACIDLFEEMLKKINEDLEIIKFKDSKVFSYIT